MYNVSREVYLPKAFCRNEFKLRLLKCSSVTQHEERCYHVLLETVFHAMYIMCYYVVTELYVERSVSAEQEALKKKNTSEQKSSV